MLPVVQGFDIQWYGAGTCLAAGCHKSQVAQRRLQMSDGSSCNDSIRSNSQLKLSSCSSRQFPPIRVALNLTSSAPILPALDGPQETMSPLVAPEDRD